MTGGRLRVRRANRSVFRQRASMTGRSSEEKPIRLMRMRLPRLLWVTGPGGLPGTVSRRRTRTETSQSCCPSCRQPVRFDFAAIDQIKDRTVVQSLAVVSGSVCDQEDCRSRVENPFAWVESHASGTIRSCGAQGPFGRPCEWQVSWTTVRSLIWSIAAKSKRTWLAT